jgi:hypothetical protein
MTSICDDDDDNDAAAADDDDNNTKCTVLRLTERKSLVPVSVGPGL